MSAKRTENTAADTTSAMSGEAEYDVFISYSRRDYIDENRKPREDSPVWLLWKYLDGHGVKCWIDLEGVYAGSQFAGLISDAIDESKMMIFVSSEHSNSSDWTIGEVLTAHDEGKPIIPFRIDDTPYSKKFSIILRPLDYIEWSPDSEESFASVLRSVEAVKNLYDEKLAEQRAESERQEVERKKTEIREHIAQTVSDYSAQAVKLRNLFDDIAKSHLALGDKKTICPVCGKPSSIGSRFCKHCGWTFVPPFVIAGEKDELPSGDPELMALMQTKWQEWQSTAGSRNEIKKLNDKIGLLYEERQASINRISVLEDKNRKLKGIEELLRNQLDVLDTKLKHLPEPYNGIHYNNGFESVDLGLPSGLLWATCNVGASGPSEYGGYFAWGETKQKNICSLGNYAFGMRGESDSLFSKYVTESKYGRCDDMCELEMCDDAANHNLGGEWHIPTCENWLELHGSCYMDWVEQDGIRGFRIMGKNGNSIFLPAAGLYAGDGPEYVGVSGYYWSSSLYPGDSRFAMNGFFSSDAVNCLDWHARHYGFSVRPVISSSSVEDSISQ